MFSFLHSVLLPRCWLLANRWQSCCLITTLHIVITDQRCVNRSKFCKTRWMSRLKWRPKRMMHKALHFNKGWMYSCCNTIANERTFQTDIIWTARSSHASGHLSGVHPQFSRQAAGASLEQAASCPQHMLQMLSAPASVHLRAEVGKAFSLANQEKRLRQGQHKSRRLCIYKSALSFAIYHPSLFTVSVEGPVFKQLFHQNMCVP